MALQDLNQLAQKLQNQFKAGFVADDTELPDSFKNHVKNLGEYSFSYKRYLVHMKSPSLDGYIPNVWFIIASYFVEYYNEVIKYKELFGNTLRELGVSNSDRDSLLGKFPKLADSKYKAIPSSDRTPTKYTLCQNEATAEIAKEVAEILDKSSLLADDKLYLTKFVSDYNWWHGGKTIDRGDFYVSPILTLANVVNASHSFIADLCKFLSNEEIAASYLRHPNAVVIEKSLPAFFYNSFRFIYDKEDKLNSIFNHIAPGSTGSSKYAYKYNGLKQTNFFVKGEEAFLQTRNGDFNPNPFIFKGDKYYLSQELARQRASNNNEVSYFGLKSVIEYHYPNYLLIEESDCYILVQKQMSMNPSSPLQQIFYGAPGTGKSFIIDENTNESNRIRTTFHPDYDYATFVGAYKPTVKTANKYGLFGKDTVALKNEDDSPIKEDVIIYKFIPQTFIKAYVEAWRRYADTECTDKDFYLVIEEINRGNCAQIFGDLFQLLDRTNAGFSSYAVETESDLQDFLTTDEKYKLDIVLTEDIKNDNGKIIATAENVMNGKVLVLPPNLHIWATMNTSDQSLFPIDSAFKRRWEWKYVPIEYGNKEWKVVLSDNTECEWTELQQTLNDLIYDATDSEDKMLGDWFVKANGNEINEDQLVGKIIFYLWNDVAKVDAGKLFALEIEKNGRKRKVIFSDFYEIDGSVSTVIVKSWLNNIGIELIEINSDTEDNSRKRYKLNNGALESLTDIANHVVRDFANNNPTMNAQQIRDIFVDAYKGCGISHIVETDEEYKLREGQPSLKRSASTVILPNGEIVHVSTQLRAKNEGDNFFNFIKVTKEKGWGEITE